MNPHPISFLAVVFGRAKKVIIALVFLALVAQAMAQNFVASEDRSRFREQPYRQAEPGLLPPSAYIQMAKKAVHDQAPNLSLMKFSDGIVTRRFYHNAPVADRDIICVQFVYEGVIGGGGLVGNGFIAMKADRPTPVIQALIRKDRSKIYLNLIHYKQE